jgi:hypothetical protein
MDTPKYTLAIIAMRKALLATILILLLARKTMSKITVAELAFQLGAASDGSLATNLVMHMLNTTPQWVLDAYHVMTTPVGTAPKFPGDLTYATHRTVVEHLKKKEKVSAVKAVRMATGCGLKEGLDHVNAVEEALARATDTFISDPELSLSVESARDTGRNFFAPMPAVPRKFSA